MTTTLTDMVAGVRQMLRDFPQYFEVDEGPLNVLTIRLPHPFVAPTALQVYIISTNTDTPPVSTTVLTDEWTLDERYGLLKLNNAAFLGKRVLVAGYHYSWFSDTDLLRYTDAVSAEHLYDRPETSVAAFSPVESEVVQIGAVVRALWSLSIELALDIDVSTPEGVFLPVHQRYAQVQAMMAYWESEYTNRAASLNVGLGALEIFRLRRVSYTTGRYVPVYREREIDDFRPPVRLRPRVPSGIQDIRQSDDVVEDYLNGVVPALPASVEELGRESFDLGHGGWFSIGTSG